MKKFGVVVIGRASGERWTHSTWSDLGEAEDQRKTLEVAMPGAVIQVHDWSDIIQERRRLRMKEKIKYKVTKYGRSCFARGEFCLEYPSGGIVTAPSDTYGIMVFDTYKQALDFIDHVDGVLNIIEVEPIGRGKRVKHLSGRQGGEEIRKFYLKRDRSWPAPRGTVCYPSVKVLE